MEGVFPDKLCGALQTHFHRWGRYGKRQLQRHFLRKRGAAGIPGHHFIKQKSHRFCISASTMASYWSGRRGSNSLPPPWQGGALPDELRPHIRCICPCTLPSDSCEFRGPRESLRSKILWGRGGISEFVTAVLLVRLPDKRLTFRRATRIGLEPTTPSVTGWCSNQLSYRATWWKLTGSNR